MDNNMHNEASSKSTIPCDSFCGHKGGDVKRPVSGHDSDAARRPKWPAILCSILAVVILAAVILAVTWKDTFQIKFELDGGTAENPGEYRWDGDAITLLNPTKVGYTFLGWTGTGLNGITKDVTIPAGSYGDRAYTAQWQADTYTITLKPEGGKVESTTITVTYDTAFTLPIPTREKHSFLGWYLGDTQVTDGVWNRTGDITLTARWDDSQYQITYNLDGGTNASGNVSSFTIDSQITLQDPTKNGYQFLGWYADSGFKTKVTQINKGTQGNITLYAKWEVMTYTITYELNDGIMPDNLVTTFTIEDLPISLPKVYRTDTLRFLHWGTGHQDGVPISEITTPGDITVSACFIDPGLSLIKPTGVNSYYVVSNYSGDATHVDIPKYYRGLPVKEIGDYAFKINGLFGSTNLKSVHLPDTITRIGTGAFQYCSQLRSINIPDSVVTIDSDAFLYCIYLKNIQLPQNLQSLGSSAFDHCWDLESITIPDSVTSLGSAAFADCSKLTTVKLGEGMTRIPDRFFEDCGALGNITIPSNITEIGGNAFDGCYSLSQIIIPKSVSRIGSSAFYGSKNLVICCEAGSIPEGWDTKWNSGYPIENGWEANWNYGHYVLWGYDQDPTYTFVTNGGTSVPSQTATKVLTAPISTKAGYGLYGWYDNPECSGEPVKFPYFSDSKRTLYAKWMDEKEFYNGTSMSRAFQITTDTAITVQFDTTDQYIYYCIIPTETKTYTLECKTYDHQFYIYSVNGHAMDFDIRGNRREDGKVSLSWNMVAGEKYCLRIYSDLHTSDSLTPFTFIVQ